MTCRTREVDVGDHSLRSALEVSAAYISPIPPAVAVRVSAGVARGVVTRPGGRGDLPRCSPAPPEHVPQCYQDVELVRLGERRHRTNMTEARARDGDGDEKKKKKERCVGSTSPHGWCFAVVVLGRWSQSRSRSRARMTCVSVVAFILLL